jgi:hypothetical protein
MESTSLIQTRAAAGWFCSFPLKALQHDHENQHRFWHQRCCAYQTESAPIISISVWIGKAWDSSRDQAWQCNRLLEHDLQLRELRVASIYYDLQLRELSVFSENLGLQVYNRDSRWMANTYLINTRADGLYLPRAVSLCSRPCSKIKSTWIKSLKYIPNPHELQGDFRSSWISAPRQDPGWIGLDLKQIISNFEIMQARVSICNLVCIKVLNVSNSIRLKY